MGTIFKNHQLLLLVRAEHAFSFSCRVLTLLSWFLGVLAACLLLCVSWRKRRLWPAGDLTVTSHWPDTRSKEVIKKVWFNSASEARGMQQFKFADTTNSL